MIIVQKIKICILLFLIPVFLFSQKKDILEFKIGQMIIMGLPDNVVDINSSFYKDMRDGKLGGITMYKRHLIIELIKEKKVSEKNINDSYRRIMWMKNNWN